MYGMLVAFRSMVAVISVLLSGGISIPFDLIALVCGIWITTSSVRTIIVVIEVINLILSVAIMFMGGFLSGLLGIAVAGICLYVINLPEIKERFE